VFAALKNTCPNADCRLKLQRHFIEGWLGRGTRQLASDLVAFGNKYVDLDTTNLEECRAACRRFGEAANESDGLWGMMRLHDAVLFAQGSSWLSRALDGSWDGIGEWQSQRGWYFQPGSITAGRYVFGTPATSRGYTPSPPIDCLESGIQHFILRVCTTATDQARQSALEMMTFEKNPFALAACAWVVGQTRMTDAVPRLETLLHHASFVVRVYAAEALWRINGNRDEVLPSLLRVLEFDATLLENWKAQLRAGRLIAELGELDASALPILASFEMRLQENITKSRDELGNMELSPLDGIFRSSSSSVLDGGQLPFVKH
jgi:hypothetical protein